QRLATLPATSAQRYKESVVYIRLFNIFFWWRHRAHQERRPRATLDPGIGKHDGNRSVLDPGFPCLIVAGNQCAHSEFGEIGHIIIKSEYKIVTDSAQFMACPEPGHVRRRSLTSRASLDTRRHPFGH